MPNIVKNTTFPSFFDLLAPHSCRGCGAIGDVLCKRCKNYILANRLNICPNCKAPLSRSESPAKCSHCPNLPPTYIIGEKNALIGALVRDLKYHSVRPIAPHLADILNRTLPSVTGRVKIVPLPTISKHIRARGLDHTKLVAKHLAKLRPNFQVSDDILLRAKNSVQVGSSAKNRATQAAKAYAINPAASINPAATYLLLDDVWTTGASMRAAIKNLLSAGIPQDHIIIAVLALNSV